MELQSENLDFSGLFKLDVLVHLDIAAYSFYEVGLNKYLAFSSDKEFIFFYINRQSERFEKNYDWDFIDNPIYCMCFEPSGTWLLILSDQKVLLVPFLPLFIPQNTFDQKWSSSRVTVLPIAQIPKPTSVVWWLTKESENILIIGSKTGAITFYSLESQTIVGECKVSGEIVDLQMCFDDSLDLLALLISKNKSQHCKLVLEHRSYGYNWLHQIRAQSDKDKKDSFMSYIKQLSKDKITLFIGSKDENKSQTVEHVLKPTEYLPLFRKGSNNWALTAQYVNGRHFLSAFELNEGTLILESPEENTPSRTLRPKIKKDSLYMQALWSQRILYLVRKNEIEVHSASFSVAQGDGLLGTKREFSELWSAELIGEVRRAHLMAAKDPPASPSGWQNPTFMRDLQLPRFSLEACLVITNCGAYILNTVCDPCEWLVGVIMRGGFGAEQGAAALGVSVPFLLRAAADMLMSRGKIAPACYLYSLSQCEPEGWVARLGIFGRLQELSMYKQVGNVGSLGNGAITIKLLALMLKMAFNREEKFEPEVKYTTLNTLELSELSSIAAAIGLWSILPAFSIHRGQPNLILASLKNRPYICRGAINCLTEQRCLVPYLLKEDDPWLFEFINVNCDRFDTTILKRLCLWLNPFHDQFRPIIRDIKQGISTVYTTRMLNLISTFVRVASAIELRHPCPEIHFEMTHNPETWKSQFVPRRVVSCGLSHWAVVDEGNLKIMMTNTPVNVDMIGRVIDVACGRHHTLVLTENGIYSAGDNSFGQLGVGESWAGAIGDAASPAGDLLHVQSEWTAPVVAVYAGHYHSAAVDAGGRLYTWGWGVHGQLGHGSIDDVCSPKMVTRFQGRKILSVGCGACHTVFLMKNGEVWSCGAAVFGQLGTGNREKSSVPVRVSLPEAIDMIAVGYFHTVALSPKGILYTWGASPQQVRAAHARRTSCSPPASPASPTAPPDDKDPHLTPAVVDISLVQGTIVQMAAGWHHTCIMNNFGAVYSWGLNFDGQLGSGDRKQVHIPTNVKICNDVQPEKNSATTPEMENAAFRTRAIVACGGAFTIYVDNDGRVYSTGSNNMQVPTDKDKTSNRVIMMKTTKRVIKIPASKSSIKFLFQHIDRIDIMFPFDTVGSQRKPIEPRHNPLTSLEDFDRICWAHDVIILLKSWITKEDLAGNLSMSAKLAYHNNDYSECLRMLLENLKTVPQNDCVYLTHIEATDYENQRIDSHVKDELKIVITNVISKRIKDVSLTILNEHPYPEIDPAVSKSLPCCCDEYGYLRKSKSLNTVKQTTDINLSMNAANIIDKCMSIFPVDAKLWEACFKHSKDFFINNSLSVSDLETVVRKYMETNATTMAAAIMYSNDCSHYSEILSPKLYLNMCSQVLDTWS